MQKQIIIEVYEKGLVQKLNGNIVECNFPYHLGDACISSSEQ